MHKNCRGIIVKSADLDEKIEEASCNSVRKRYIGNSSGNDTDTDTVVVAGNSLREQRKTIVVISTSKKERTE